MILIDMVLLGLGLFLGYTFQKEIHLLKKKLKKKILQALKDDE